MWIWICALILIICALTILIFKRMPIEIIYAASAKHKKQAFRVKVYSIDIIRDKSKKSAKSKKKKDKKSKEKKDFSFEKFMKWLSWIKDIYKAIKDCLTEVFEYLGKKAQCRNFTVHLDLGFESAADTGIAAGAAYGSVYGAASLVYNNLDIKKEELDIRVTPHFDNPCGDLYVKGIFYLSIAHIIKVVLMLLKVNKKIKQIIKQ